MLSHGQQQLLHLLESTFEVLDIAAGTVNIGTLSNQGHKTGLTLQESFVSGVVRQVISGKVSNDGHTFCGSR